MLAVIITASFEYIYIYIFFLEVLGFLKVFSEVFRGFLTFFSDFLTIGLKKVAQYLINGLKNCFGAANEAKMRMNELRA